MKKLAFMLVYVTAPTLVAGLHFGGWTIALTPLLVFLLILGAGPPALPSMGA